MIPLFSSNAGQAKQTFRVVLISPSNYDDQGYVIQWLMTQGPVGALSCFNGLVLDAKQRKVLGPEIDIEIDAYDELSTVIPVKKIIREIRKSSHGGIVCFVGVQTNHFPRAMDMAGCFRKEGVQVAMGGFHVSGMMAMMPDLTPELKEAVDLGVVLFAGEAEKGLHGFLKDAHTGRLKPIYDYLKAPPDLKGAAIPVMPLEKRKWGRTSKGHFDAGRGCPFLCDFCSIINVQGHAVRCRDVEDIEKIISMYLKNGITRFLISDDNFARNKIWAAIFDKFIKYREKGNDFEIIIQADAMAHRIPGFIEKAAKAGCKAVFIGLESVNPDNLKLMKKLQNHIDEYKQMLMAWRRQGIITICGYIIGFPEDTPESIARDIRWIQRELPVDVLNFSILTALPGSALHRDLVLKKAWIEPDFNKYQLTHAITNHPRMSRHELEQTFYEASKLYFSQKHIEVLIRRFVEEERNPKEILPIILNIYGFIMFEKIPFYTGGLIRIKKRGSRRPGFPKENAIMFALKRFGEVITTTWKFLSYHRRLKRICGRVLREAGR